MSQSQPELHSERQPPLPSRPKLPFIVGLTGGIGSGKTTVADRFGALGATLVDTDVIAHELTGPQGPAMAALIAEFGAGIAAADGRMDRTVMRDIVFRDPAARQRLEAILHPRIRQLSEYRIATATGPYVISVVPLLVEGGKWQGRFDRVLVVDCPEDVQIARVMARNGHAREQVLAIMAAQASRAQRLAAADDVIDNGGNADGLDSHIERLHQRYLKMARDKAGAR